ncbi:MAG: cadherin-like beta sandwich domain-containing protein [Clostridia bacterium]|nr:cadherin-like beta sandwich domain-containing protein [Clostridia bacterium]
MNKKIIKYIIISSMLLVFTIFYINKQVQATTINEDEIIKVSETNSKNTVTNPDDANFYLKSLTIDGYDMYPEFNKNTNQYYVSIPTNVNSLDVNAEPEIDKSTVKITGNSKLSKTENSITVDVTAKNKEVKRYTITVTKQEDNGLKLESLEIEGASLNPIFSENRYFYKTSLKVNKEGDKIKSLNIKAKPKDEDASIEIYGDKDIIEGENLVTILLKKGDNTSIYQINVNITSQTMVTSLEDTRNEFVKFIDTYKDEIIKWFEDDKKKIATIIAGGVVLIVIVILIILHIRKKNKSKKNAENLKKRAR